MTQAYADTPDTMILTGSTGFVGSHFLFWTLSSRSTRVAAIVRGVDPASARDRLCNQLRAVAASYHAPLEEEALSRLMVVPGDIERELCGIDADLLEQLRSANVSAFWNFAASLSFEDRNRDAIERANVRGTRHALQLAAAIDAARYNQISTAYTCGRRRGEIPERLHDPAGPFNNHYERTKCEGEHIVDWTCREQGRPFAILRPSIVVGPAKTMLPGGSDSGLYGFAREIHRLGRALRAVEGALHIVGEPNAELNFIPVDQLVQDLWALHDEGYPCGPVHHMTSHRSATVAETMSAVADACHVCPISVEEERTQPASPVERLFERRADFYASYMKFDKRFERAWGPRRSVTAGDVKAYVERFVSARAVGESTAPFTRHTVTARDGMPLCAYEAGSPDAATIVLVNAYGMPVDYFVPLAKQLCSKYRLVTWESRGVPSQVGQLTEGNCGLADHVSDLGSVMDFFSLETAHVLGFCTGADVAISFAAQHPDRALSLSLANGALWSENAARSTFQENLGKVMPACATSLKHAELYHSLIYGHASTRGDEQNLCTWNSLLDALDPALVHVTSVPFRTPDVLHRYALTMCRYQADTQEPSPPVRVPALVLTAEDDPIAHWSASVGLALRTPTATLEVFDGTGHFGLYLEPRTWDRVDAFVSALGGGASAGSSQPASFA